MLGEERPLNESMKTHEIVPRIPPELAKVIDAGVRANLIVPDGRWEDLAIHHRHIVTQE